MARFMLRVCARVSLECVDTRHSKIKCNNTQQKRTHADTVSVWVDIDVEYITSHLKGNQMGRNSDSMVYSGYDMHGFKWRVSDETVGPDKYEAAALGWKLVRNGRMRRYYRLSDNMLMEAYSYNTCIMTRMTPDEDFPYGRLVINETLYSATSKKHQNEIKDAFNKYKFLHPDNANGNYMPGIYMSYRIQSVEWKHRANTINAHTDINGDELRKAVICSPGHAAFLRENMRRQRLERIARIKQYNSDVDTFNANNKNVITLDFRRAEA